MTQQPPQHPYKARLTILGETEMAIEREFDAPRDVVWATVSDPELIPEWWGPGKYPTRVVEMDFRVGGKWRFECLDDGEVLGFSGEYLEIRAPEVLTQTFRFDPMPGTSTEASTYTEHPGGRTLLTVRARHDNKESLDGMIASGMEKGVNETYDRLDAVLARRLAEA